MTTRIDTTEVGRYKRHNAHDTQADKEVAKSKAKSSSKLVASAQTAARKRNCVQAIRQDDKENKTPATPTTTVVQKERKRKGEQSNENVNKLPDNLASRKNGGKS